MNEKFHRIIFIIIAIAISATMFSLVSDYGSSTAEDEYQINNAIQLDRYYKSFGSDTSILENTRPMYSGWFNALTVTLSAPTPGLMSISPLPAVITVTVSLPSPVSMVTVPSPSATSTWTVSSALVPITVRLA